jgi:hypothetical protein
MTPVIRNKPTHDVRRNIHIEKIAKMLDAKLTLQDTPVLMKELASAVVDIYDRQDELHRTILGYNGDPGMNTMLTRIQMRLGIADDGSVDQPKPEPDRFSKFVTWCADKIAPPVVTAITLGLLYLIFGRPAP